MLLTERLTYPEAIEVVGKLLSLFPNGSPANAKGYIGGLAQILLAYPKAVAIGCANPLTGVPKDTKFLPTPADLIAWLERETQAMRKPVEREDRDQRIAREMADRRDEGEYWQKARAKRPSFEEMKAKHGPNWGIRGASEAEQTAARTRQTALVQAGNERAWSRMGGVISGGIPITDALRKTIKPAEHQADA